MSEKKQRGVSRREFLRKSAQESTVFVSAAAVARSATTFGAQEEIPVARHDLVAALGDTLVPSNPDPGYTSLEVYNITAEVMKRLTILSDADLRDFNEAARPFFGGRTFLDLSEGEREEYLDLIVDGNDVEDARLLRTLRKVYGLTRTSVLTVYYRNYPEHIVPRDENDIPVLPPGDRHQITNPNTNRIVTGWDIAGYQPQLSWEQEEERRARAKRLGLWIGE